MHDISFESHDIGAFNFCLRDKEHRDNFKVYCVGSKFLWYFCTGVLSQSHSTEKYWKC